MKLMILWVLLLAGCMGRTDYLFAMALDQQKANNHQAAIALYQELITENPSAEGAWHNLGISHYLAGDPQAAQSAIEQAIAMHPKSVLSRFVLAVIHLENRNWGGAIRIVREARSIRRDRIAATVSRFGAPTFIGLDYRITLESFEKTLDHLEKLAVKNRLIDPVASRTWVIAVLMGNLPHDVQT